ncbi:hypothetical protein HOLleu_30909 [Holothuria leucospilota]|uniref:Reverse transcriptase domain-containing protein n=1 Tax=Holothuria leucospilota TaxID=206669 RepID=A0A9Q1BL40_HOLLE|nr:hypothetical protein HOLleu_30909 [Holothuria leucospilota]
MKTRGDKQTTSKFPASFATLNQPPRLSFFVGDQKPKSGEADFETWKYEVECLQREGGFAKEILTPLVKRSLRGEAGEIARHLGVDASIKEIIEKLETLYGTVESGSTLLRQVYTSRQEAEETAAQYGRRLQVKINRARERGGISSLAIDETLKSVFWQGMRDANVKNALRHRKDTVGSFDELLRLVRLAEQEAAEDASRFPARTTGKRVTGSAFVQSTDGPREASRLTERGRLGETPQSDVKAMVDTRCTVTGEGTRKSALERIVGSVNESEALVNGVPCRCLVHTGSQVTTISEPFHREFLGHCKAKPLDDLLRIEGAGGQDVPFLGYKEVKIAFPSGTNATDTREHDVVVLVVPSTEFNKKVPLIIGTNLIEECRSQCKEIYGAQFLCQSSISEPWRLAYKYLNEVDRISSKGGRLGCVRAHLKNAIAIQPQQSKIIRGLTKRLRRGNRYNAVVEAPTGGLLPTGLVVHHMFLTVKGGPRAKIPVSLYNNSDEAITITPKMCIAELSLGTPLGSSMQVLSQYAQTSDATEKGKEDSADFMEEFVWDDSPVTQEQMSKLKDVIFKNQDVFAKHKNDLGHARAVKHEILVKSGIPFKERYRRIAPAQYDQVRQCLQDMLDSGAIRESHSPYASPIVVVKKKDGSIRLCIDYRRLNNDTIKDAYALPRIEESLDALCGAKWFSSLDLQSGYWQIEMAEKDKEKTAFTTPMGFYECNRMPFGLTNAPATFQRLMERCVGDMNLKQCLVYLDDVIIFSKAFEEHLERLNSVFQRLRDFGLKLKPSKCEFLRQSVNYLGHIVSARGVETDPEKTERIRKWPVPINVKQLRKFLGFTGYYRRFVKDYSKIAKPLHELTGGCSHSRGKKKSQSKPTTWNWSNECQVAFDLLVSKLVSPPILAYADYSLPFELHTDASTEGLGAALYQEQDGVKRVIAYASRGLRKSERNYPAHKLEFLALKWAVTDKFKDYLYGRKFQVVTDNNPLTYVLTTAKLDATGHRWLAALAAFDFNIVYRPGALNGDADALSRLPARDDREESSRIDPNVLRAIYESHHVNLSEEGSENSYTPLVEAISLSQNAIPVEFEDNLEPAPQSNYPHLSKREWKELQEKDTIVSRVLHYLKMNRRPNLQERKKEKADVLLILRDWDRLCFIDNVLYRKRNSLDGKVSYQLVLPMSQWETVVEQLHDSVGHLGYERVLDLARARCFWPRLASFIENRIKNCERCLRRKAIQPASSKAPLVSINVRGAHLPVTPGMGKGV